MQPGAVGAAYAEKTNGLSPEPFLPGPKRCERDVRRAAAIHLGRELS